jgi:hypothetical protein
MPVPSQMRPYIAPAPNPQMMSEVSPSMEVRGGTVYFNAETQQPELRVGGIYYGPAGQQGSGTVMQAHRPSSAIPIVHPQVRFESPYFCNSTFQVLLRNVVST